MIANALKYYDEWLVHGKYKICNNNLFYVLSNSAMNCGTNFFLIPFTYILINIERVSKHSVTFHGLRVVTTCWSWAWSNHTSPSKWVGLGSPPLAAGSVYGDLSCSVHSVNNVCMFSCQCHFYICNWEPYVRLTFVQNLLSTWSKDVIIIIKLDWYDVPSIQISFSRHRGVCYCIGFQKHLWLTTKRIWNKQHIFQCYGLICTFERLAAFGILSTNQYSRVCLTTPAERERYRDSSKQSRD